MNCGSLEGIAHELIEGVLPPDEAAEARAHAAVCESCADRLKTAERFVAFLSGPGDAALERHAARIASQRAVAARSAPRLPRGAGVLRPLFAAAAAAALVALAFTLFVLPGERVLAEGGAAEIGRGERVRAGEGRELLAEEAARVFVPVGAAGERVRLDAGTVLFRVEPGNAFAVETPQGVATVLGTSFHVGVGAGGRVHVAVHSGRVRFARSRGEPVVLSPGDRLEADARETRVLGSSRVLDLEEELGREKERSRLLEARADALRTARPAAEPEPSLPDALRSFFASEEGRKALEDAVEAEQARLGAEAAKAMVEWRLGWLRKSLELTDDQVRRLRETFRKAGAESWKARQDFQQLPDDAPEADRRHARDAMNETTAQIHAREDAEIRAILSQTQYEAYSKLLRAPSGDSR